MDLKNDVFEKLATIDCKEKIKETLAEHSDDIAKKLHLGSESKGALDAIQRGRPIRPEMPGPVLN